MRFRLGHCLARLCLETVYPIITDLTEGALDCERKWKWKLYSICNVCALVHLRSLHQSRPHDVHFLYLSSRCSECVSRFSNRRLHPPEVRRVWLQTCTLRHLHAQTLALPQVMSLAVFFILFYLLIIFCLNLSKFYNSSQVVKTRKNKIKYNVTCNRCLHFLLPATSLAFDTNHVRCQRRQVDSKLNILNSEKTKALIIVPKNHKSNNLEHCLTLDGCSVDSLLRPLEPVEPLQSDFAAVVTNCWFVWPEGNWPPDWAWFLPRFFLRSVTDGVLVPCRCRL